MRLKLHHAAPAIALSFALMGCASAQSQGASLTNEDVAAQRATTIESAAAIYDVSPAALATAVIGLDGQPVGTEAYTTPVNAVKAGDMAAFITMLKAQQDAGEDIGGMRTLFLALDEAAAGDTEGARAILRAADAANEIDTESKLFAYIDSWLLAMDGETDAAIERYRRASGELPGLVGDLSLAAMLDALDRPEQALAVYESMTPSRIEAPEHEFDPKGLLYSHVRTVIGRHALLLQRLGRIDEAKAVYQKLADAEPEEAASYAAAMESLETGENLDNEQLTVEAAFSRSLSDLSRSLQEQRIIRLIMLGGRPDGFDDLRSAFDQVALLIHPEDEGLRSSVIDQFYEHALYDSVTHTALTAPETSANLQISAAQAFIMAGKEDRGREAIEAALAVSDDDDELQTLYGALQLRTLLDDRDEAFKLVSDVQGLAENPAEKAAAHGLASQIYGQFGQLDDAAEEAGKARALDDTHDRRMVQADALGKAGDIDGALKILRSERLSRPNDPYTLNSLGYFLLVHTDKYEEAYKVLGRANALAENDPYIADSFGWARYKLGDLEGAERMIKFSQGELAPHQHWEIEDHLGDIYWHQGRKEEARKAWATALENRPPDVEKAKINDKLANGISEPAPEKRPLPEIPVAEEEIDRRDI